jgi:PAS domain S-box-containing protein
MAQAERKIILLVEDEFIISLAESEAIKRFGYDVLVANSGEEAIRLASPERKVDLILMDIDLGGGIDGPEAARRILGARNIPIVFLTSNTGKEHVESVKRITRYGYVIKSSNDFVLQSSIEMAFALFEANRKAQKIIESLVDYIYTVYYEDGQVSRTMHNPACIAVTGYSAKELTDDPYLWFNMILPEDRDRVEMHMATLPDTSNPASIEHRIRRKDGTVRWIRNTPVLHFDSSGALVSQDGIIVDVTERRLAEERIQALQRERDLLLRDSRRDSII